MFYAANASYCMSTAFIKISLLLQYLRVIDRRSLVARRLCAGLIVFVSLWGTAYSVLGWFPCLPVHMFWDRTAATTAAEATCFAYGSLKPDAFSATYESHSAVNMALDLTVLAMPMPLFLSTDAQRRKTRLALVAILAMGAM